MRMIADLCLLLMLASACVAQGSGAGTAEIRKVKVVRFGDKIKLEIILTRSGKS